MPEPITRKCNSCGQSWTHGDLIRPEDHLCPKCGKDDSSYVPYDPATSPRPFDREVAGSSDKPDKMAAGLSHVNLPERLSKFLAGQPETGMGYQEVVCSMSDGKRIPGIVLNGSVLETVVPVDVGSISSISVTR